MTFVPVTAQQTTLSNSKGILTGGALVAGVEVSVMLSESHSLTAQATKQTLESGTQVSDHILIEPYTVSIAYEVSNAGDGASRAKDVFETFKNILEKRELLELTTEHYIYDNMVLTNLTPLHAAPYKGRLQCTATLQRVNQVKIAVVGRAPAKLKKGPIQKTGSAPVEGGQVNVKKSEAAERWDNASGKTP